MATKDEITGGALTRLRHAASNDRTSLHELIDRSDRELMRLPGIGPKCVALARRLRARGPDALWFWAQHSGTS